MSSRALTQATVRFALFGLALSCVLVPAPGRAQDSPCNARDPLPVSLQLDFVAHARRSGIGLDGDNQIRFTRGSDGSYELSSETRSLLFSARQDSRGKFTAESLVPAEYVERTQRRPVKTTRFDWQSRTVSFTTVDTTKPTQPMMQDRLSMLLQLSLRMRLQPADAESIDIPVAGVRDTSIYRFALREKEATELPAGRFRTIRLERPLDKENDRVEVWLAPELCWLPVKLRFTDDRGLVVENELRQSPFAPAS